MLLLLIFLLTFSGGVLSGRRPPKHKDPKCPQNEHYVRKDTTCPKTCGNRMLPGETVVECNPFTGCVCDSGYLRLYDNGTGPCIARNKCAPIPKKCGKNEIPTSCKTVCPPLSCESMYLACDCEPGACEPGCDCIDEYLRNEDGDCVPVDECFSDGKSTENDDCIRTWNTIFSSSASAESRSSASSNSSYSNGTSSSHSSSSSSSTSSSSSSTSIHTSSGCGTKCKDKNAVYKKCPNPCPLTCDEPKPRPCPRMCLQYGCECKPGFILTKIGGTCILPDDCPKPLCPKHEHYVINDPNEVMTCGNRLIPGDTTEDCMSFTGCLCDSGYVRKYDNGTGPCIPEDLCPPIPTNCGKNEEPSSCRIVCPPQSCESVYSFYKCLPTDCEPGCNCKDGYLRNIEGVCILSETCPATPMCGENEVASECKIVCPPQSCESIYITYLCAEGPCTPGCNCKDGYLRNSLDVCIPSDQCFSDSNPCDDPNASPQECASTCQPTCENPDTSAQICTLSCVIGGCVCNLGYILDKVGGKCIKKEDCPKNQTCSDPNASPQDCPSYCQPTCDQPDTSELVCPAACLPSGCVCNPGYILDEEDGTCIKIEDCPRNQQCSDPNASPSTEECTSPCQPTCEQPDTSDIICIMSCEIGACVCNPGYILDFTGGTCIKIEDCQATEKCIDPNASPMPCPSYCQPTCGQPDTSDILCVDACLPSGCVCNPGYILDEDGGKCIKVEDCPDNQQCSDPNASPQYCPSYCQPTCDQPDTSGMICIAVCLPGGCVCNPGYILDTMGGTCIRKEDCPRNQQCSDPNASPSTEECTSPCQPTCEQPDTSDIICIMSCQIGACVCNPGFVLDKAGGTCIKIENCPGNEKCKDPNASPQVCPSSCQPTCDQPDTRDIICDKACLPGGCVCDEGYILDKNEGTCIKPEKCPGGSPKCCGNKTYVDCYVDCLNRYCPIDDSTGIVMCRGYGCYPGCACNDGYLMLSDTERRCVLSSECPPVDCTRPNEVWDPSPSNCNQERCEDMYSDCDDSSTGPPRCVCKSGYYKNDSDICVPASECDNQGCGGDRNATSVVCPDPNPPTCAEPGPNSGSDAIDLETDPMFTCLSIGCECKSGFILSHSGGICIDPRDCPDNQSCNGDNNATIKECPNACPATCADPDTRNRLCPAICLGIGCECKPGFIFSEDGQCIDPYDCPGGEPECGANKTYVYCSAGCPYSYCPTDDSRDFIACDPPYPCPSGCDCEPGYLMLSYENPQCVLSSDCPPVTCTRPNEVWDPSPSNCNLESCDDIDRECDDTSTGQPKCVCISGYYRDNTDVCVPASECGNQGCGGDRNATSVVCPDPNPPTCAEPGPNSGSDAIDLETDPMFTCLSIGCECKSGFILSHSGGICIDPRDCPDNQSCNGDNNATIKECPNACPATCADPDTRNRLCPAICLGIGCECKPGFIFSEDGQCIDPYDCPGGEPECGANKTYVYCSAGCPYSYCPTDDSRDFIACDPPYPCPSGCDCEPGYLMLSYENPQCVLSSDCPPVTCTRPNEVWDPSPSNCNLESCDDIDRECDDTSTGQPKCVCISGYYRDNTDVCVPASECGNQGCGGDRNATSVVCPDPNPPTCAEPGPNSGSDAIDLETDPMFTCLSIGCECKSGFILSHSGGICIDPRDCPDNQSCNGDNNATIKECPNACPATCADPDTRNRPCPAICLGIGCECKPGFIFSEDGQCIDPYDCPGGEPECGANKTYVYCSAGCPYSYCPTDDSRDFIACDPPYPCPSGCDCEPGYLMLSYENPQCVLSSDCPPVTCTRPNEVWDPSPPNCNLESCDDIDRECDDTSTGPPKCVCISGYCRDNTEVCVPASECGNQGCGGDRNATSVVCPDPNPPTCAEPGPNSGSDAIDLETDPMFTCLSIGCECKSGFILSHSGGICIDPRDCPDNQSCNGDNNATIKECPNACPATCADPDTRNRPCPEICLGIGCECKPGFIFSEDGQCIDPYDCPGGEPECGANKTYVYCSAGCPYSYCPTDDSRDFIACDPPYPCPSGCDCEPGYLMLSYENPQCVLSSDCPPVTCTRPNEVWNPSPSNCNLESCDDIDRECDDTSTGPPKCVCISGYCRDNSDVCVLASECDNPGCGGDRNATSVICPDPNPPTCAEPETNSGSDATDLDTDPIFTCMSIGCQCKLGFIMSERGGKCIDPSDCPGGIPNCGENKTYVDCFVGCPPSYCPTSDSRAIIACAVAYPCPPGCACKPGYLMLSYEDQRCVLSSECPPVNCTRPNEVWDPSISNCYIESCEDIGRECDDTSTGPPRCRCKSGYYRDESDICVPVSECGCKGDPNAVHSDCPSNCPRTCSSDDDQVCNDACAPPGCVCKPGYVISDETGKCIKEDECPPKGCDGDPNAEHNDCPSNCPRTCSSDDDLVCNDACAPPGCVCKPGYVISDETGMCIKEDECPPKGCDGDPNAVHSDCPSNCPRTCSSDDDLVCNDACAPPGCVCKPGYVISDETGMCIKEDECPPKGCDGDPNAELNDCPSYCPRTCNSDDDRVCIALCAPPGCVCKPGYVISDETGKCIKEEECPPKGCKGDPNAVHSDCPTYCPLTCDQPDRSGMGCVAACAQPGCVCKPGYLQTKNGKCVKPDGCPGGSPNCGPNKTYVPCQFGCPTNFCPTSDSLAMVSCSPPFPCPGGCACNSGYLFKDDIDFKCIKSSDCPPVKCTRPNEVWDPSPSNCISERCEDMYTKCDNNYYSSIPRCVCKPGYYRNDKNVCIPASKCHADESEEISRESSEEFDNDGSDESSEELDSKPPLKCGLNEKAVKCRTICPPQNCEISYTDYDCSKFKNICEPGCDCLTDYLRNGSGICIFNEDCPYPSFPICGPNEIARDCRRICPPQTCDSRFIMYNCLQNIACEPGCDCVPNYLRNSEGVCIPADKCGAFPSKCPIPKKCIRTCASPNPRNCPYTPAKRNRDGCECMEGYIMSEIGGICIRIEDCPIEKGCNGDLHARTKQCPLPCPSTCESPNATPCKKMCEPIGCECEPGYIFCKASGKCILPDDCPGGNPCGENEEFRQCKYNCPQDYCPVDDSRDIVCDPFPVCLSGCACKLNYRRLSQEDDRCIIASDCPPVNCTRPNEVWDGCPSECFSGYCEDKEYQDVVCNTLLLNCQPQCICKRDTFRNGSDICVPESECPCSVPDECLRTCASPNPPNCPYEPSDTNIDGCNCMEGYILSEIGGECIKIEECPDDGSCNGDPNARPKRCPIPCPSTCKSPEAVPCKKRCDPIGCECKPEYILSKTSGQCIKPDECPGGNPCGPNANFVSCKNGCPTDYCPVDDSRAIPICEPTPIEYCLSGCQCKLNHKLLSRENKTCIVSSDCPPVDCTRPNEVWNGCPSECFSGYCEDKEYQDTVCNTLVLNCQPQCICERDTFRNGSDICVPESECPCSVPDECLRTCASPNPPNCPYEPSDTNINGCNCMEGYILSEIGGKCIKIEECPKDGSCNGDPNARPKSCPNPCPSTCKSPEAVRCKKSCEPIGCECKPGFILSKTNGQCMEPDKCPGGNPCGPNANFVSCKYGCPTNYCPVDDSRAIPICEPTRREYCLSGCKCKLNHKWLSRENKTCIVSSDCPPIKCTRPHEVWNSCPSACLAERCADIDNQPKTCQTLVLNCQPACVCKNNFFRNDSDICVSRCDC